ncbi:hypothetical protein MN116_001253 [Schistosoma mekongi]|uniref:Uncharacterized protein n=1 Tax=Schistosoma mekongi TaxID=38744 RepID=A0AAE2D974_SCHME|nr:hypothetical protein MN116_001253 [Schistosoma mekongi]
MNVDESFIDPFLELAPFSARSEKMCGEGHPKAEHSHIIRNLPMSLESLKAHLPFLATHLQETLAESGFTENSDQKHKCDVNKPHELSVFNKKSVKTSK